MPKGGRRTRSGPPPDPNALRRDRDSAEWVELPASGREGDPPAWPLSRQTVREAELWEGEWRRPQALMWEANGQEIEVAMYVRSLRQAESSKASVSLRTLVRQQMDALGLTVPGMRSNRWTIGGGTEPQVERERGSVTSVKERLRVVEGGA